ncbi:MAG: exodeoxyribonuclease V subunit alpha [Nitriliruptorales bacterium]
MSATPTARERIASHREAAAFDRDDVRIATRPVGVLEPFNHAGVLSPADVHTAATLCRITGDERPEVLLAAALAVRAPQHGHVCVDLTRVARTITGVDQAPLTADDLNWPDPARWRALLESSPLVTVRPTGTPKEIDPAADRPLSLVASRLYLDRYWRYERRVAQVLRRRADRTRTGVDLAALRTTLDRLLPPGDERPDRQRLAVATAALRSLTVIAGGPGTGKTHTVARLLALLHELAQDRPPNVALATPTGKAADRLTTALQEAAATLDTHAAVRDRLRKLEATTLHRLLGWHPGSHTRFWHDRERRLPHDIVVIDETSMVSLSLMAKLLIALRPTSQLVLVGDPDQLESVEAGAVLGDIVGPAADELRMSEPARDDLAEATGEPLEHVTPARAEGIDDVIVVLGRVRRFRVDSGIARLASAIHIGDADAVLSVLRASDHDVSWISVSDDARRQPALAPVRELVVAVNREVVRAASAGDAMAALRALDRLRILCAHRHGRGGLHAWVAQVERWLTDDLDGFDAIERCYVGRPVLVTQNDPGLRLYNGDIGVVVLQGDSLQVAFRGAQGVRTYGPSRLEHIETVHAMTIHKSQGSQFGHVVVVLPDETSPILTRELLYTAVTRAKERVTVIGSEEIIRNAIRTRIARASGLQQTLWGETAASPEAATSR